MKKLILLLPLILAASCYHCGSLMHPQVQSIAIAPVVNETAAYNLASEMRMALSEQFMTDGSLTVRDLNTADCILNARVIEVTYIEISDDSYDSDVIYRPTEWRVTVTMEFKVIIPGNREPLVSTRTVTGDSMFQVQADLATNQHQATLRACANAAKAAVVATTEAW
ncbi:MAG: LPS assembly lipoprotein LptE [Victivallaceae bacterium]|nr:LPS assembly lipoprotein LptE [Victivallaceae bacterium]